MGCVSVAVIIIALLIAFNRASRKVLREIWKWIGKPIVNFLDRVPSERVNSFVHYRDLEKGVGAGGMNARKEKKKSGKAKKSRSRNRSESRSRKVSVSDWQDEIFGKSETLES